MKIFDIIKELEVVEHNIIKDFDVDNISHDTRTIRKGEIFVALKGCSENGEQYAYDAIHNGAIAVIAETLIDGVPCIKVKNARQAWCQVIAMLTDYAHKKLKIIAVVGTNGKTTTASLIYKMLIGSGKKAALIGTLGSIVDGIEIDTNLTTPDPRELHNVFLYAVNRNVEYCVMEVSAHAIFFEKIYGLSFAAAVFTNLSQDHLDFFIDMDNYANCKKSFFRDYDIAFGIINGDDKLGREIILEELLPTISYGLDLPCDCFAIDISTKNNIKYTANICDKIGVVKTKLHGRFNVYNTLAALTTVVSLGVSIEKAIQILNLIPPVDGRYNVINHQKKVIIDYAHTPDGLKNILTAVKGEERGKLISVFGCGGNRDRSKRKLMGEISGSIADITIVTTDNSRLEDPYEIMDEIVAGVEAVGGKYQIIRNREDAIAFALLCAKKEDVIVVAGKGAERYMDEGGIKREYSDYDTVNTLLRRGDF